ncbi:MAG: hypothetical protein OFPI_37570 [Osedax symbiont Rs2]|nr:MAG: hypothetical protein OFPI_37570 [Osedax symbiont Rs2]
MQQQLKTVLIINYSLLIFSLCAIGGLFFALANLISLNDMRDGSEFLNTISIFVLLVFAISFCNAVFTVIFIRMKKIKCSGLAMYSPLVIYTLLGIFAIVTNTLL